MSDGSNHAPASPRENRLAGEPPPLEGLVRARVSDDRRMVVISIQGNDVGGRGARCADALDSHRENAERHVGEQHGRAVDHVHVEVARRADVERAGHLGEIRAVRRGHRGCVFGWVVVIDDREIGSGHESPRS